MLVMQTLAAAARARLLAANLCGGNVELHRDSPTKDELLPLANVTYDLDDGSAVGDPRTGIPTFSHKLTLVVEVLDSAPNGPELMEKMELHGHIVMLALCSDLSAWGSDIVEGIGGVRQITERANDGAEIVYRRLIQIDVLYRSVWPFPADGLSDLTGIFVSGPGNIASDIALEGPTTPGTPPGGGEPTDTD